MVIVFTQHGVLRPEIKLLATRELCYGWQVKMRFRGGMGLRRSKEPSIQALTVLNWIGVSPSNTEYETCLVGLATAAFHVLFLISCWDTHIISAHEKLNNVRPHFPQKLSLERCQEPGSPQMFLNTLTRTIDAF